ncbi:MAG TPA: biopolymer transporter ExbD [Methylomusa anaerophila]|uniref:Biopolymer transport protein ExbD n=1 Tax=Methylomusa anaerophila TaxID=1930071 RepID=A0A348AFF1_9FIRM|nr:biopolymer transporter ExbD [Methylomusa anaerophila]BBB89799.1 biopolymer transport protein ExbD [Methylomusa anaerophila]HML89154.1 biopolymer transporter ExbD [Methylomusa anaerophila]
MRIPRNPAKKARIEIIPMIDTMFFLLVFFMMATLSMTSQYSMPVNLPQAAGMPDQTRQVVTLTVTKDGKLFWDKEAMPSTAAVAARLAQQSKAGAQLAVIINADRSVEHGRVVELMDAIQQSGLAKIAIAVNHAGS